jgi:hypothetical protein
VAGWADRAGLCAGRRAVIAKEVGWDQRSRRACWMQVAAIVWQQRGIVEPGGDTVRPPSICSDWRILPVGHVRPEFTGSTPVRNGQKKMYIFWRRPQRARH